MTNLSEKAELFHSLHSSLLVLPNAWDVASARIVEDAGASAVATTSAGVAWSLGAPDGHQLARDQAIELVARVAGAVSVPVTADIENGFAVDASGVAETIGMVIEAGAVGVNLEDGEGAGLLSVDEFADRIAAARSAASIPLYLNARTDVYLRRVGEPDTRLKHTIERAHAYLAAGASGVFVPGVVDPSVLSVLVKEIDAPLNVMAGFGAPPISELAALGVARVSLGSGIAQAAYGLVHRAATEALTSGTYSSLADPFPYPQLQALFT
jgi:2-methylisocitrate lyase-like PEP mutase family enzyme